MPCKSLLLLLYFSLIIFTKSYSQQIILVEKDSSNKYHFNSEGIPNTVGYNPISVFKIEPFKDSIIVYAYIFSGRASTQMICKRTYQFSDTGFVLIREIKAEYINPVTVKGYWLFEDGTKIFD